jgi:hypothetical protein
VKEDVDRYESAAHAMQTGVDLEHELGSKDGSPKHLRVGINRGAVNIAALAKLLIAKGIITLDEYEKSAADEMERECERYTKRLVKLMGGNVHLA